MNKYDVTSYVHDKKYINLYIYNLVFPMLLTRKIRIEIKIFHL